MESRGKQWMTGYGIACMGCGRTVDNGRYLELDHRIPRREAANQPVRSHGPSHVEALDADDGGNGNRREKAGKRKVGA